MARKGINPGKSKKFVMSDEHRVKIQNSNILNALIEHTMGEREMSSTQVSSGLGLLRKVLPDLGTMELKNADGEALVVKTIYETKPPQ